MQTILGANGQIAVELARELRREFTTDIRLVSRNPRPVNDGDQLVKADLLDAQQTAEAVAGSDIVYFTAGLPADADLWERQFPTMLRNALDASRAAGAAFAYFDNTYMYPQNAQVQTEQTGFAPLGRKSKVRAQMASMVRDEIARGEIPVLIGRAPEFYGPGRTQSFTNSLIIDRLRAGKRALVPVSASTKRTLIWTPDASRALALLGNTPDAYGESWHLPVDPARLTYRQFVDLAADIFQVPARYTTLPKWMLKLAGRFSPQAQAIEELLTRYQHDNLFDSAKFDARFPTFEVTTYRRGLEIIAAEG